MTLRNWKYSKKLRFYGPSAEQASTGTLFLLYACSVVGTPSNTVGSFIPGTLVCAARHAFSDD